MRESRYSWLDALTDGRMFRQWLSLILSFALSWTYLTFVITMFMTSLALIPVLFGIPLMLFTLAAIPTLARLDYQIMDALLEIEGLPAPDSPNLLGANLGERLGYYLGSPLTWRSLLYLALKIPLGLFALLAASVIVLPLAIEVLLLAPLTIDMRLITVRLLRFTALGLHHVNSAALPTGKSKRQPQYAAQQVRDSTAFRLEDDGELAIPESRAEKALRRSVK